jgi:hypothetical protein
MPHDKFGRKIEPGDEVLIRFKVNRISDCEEYCNLGLTSIETMPPYENSFIELSAVNARQTEKVEPESAERLTL